MTTQLAERIRAALTVGSELDFPIGDNDRLWSVINIDKLLEITEELEDEFDIVLDSDDLAELTYVRDLTAYVEAALALRHAV